MSKKKRKEGYLDVDGMNISKDDMSILADHIEDYLTVLKDVFIIPEYLQKSRKQIEKAMSVTEKLIGKLRKGDRSVFKIQEDEN